MGCGSSQQGKDHVEIDSDAHNNARTDSEPIPMTLLSENIVVTKDKLLNHEAKLESTDDASTHVPVGVSIEFVRMVASNLKEIGSGNDSNGKSLNMTTTEVCKKFVIPATKERICTYIDLYRDAVDEQGKPYLGVATVSHAWKYQFAIPVDAMEQQAQQEPNAYFWFDLFVNNQNLAASLPQEWWKTKFRDSIRSIGTVMLVMSPWTRPLPITRAWCLWEIMCALGQQGVRFVGRLPQTEAMSMLREITLDGSFVGLADPRIDSEAAEAFKPEDKAMIMDAIRSTIGFDQVNKKVAEQMRISQLRGMVDCAHMIVEKNIRFRGDAIPRTLNRIGLCLTDLHGYREALEVFLMTLQFDLKEDPLSDETANSYLNIADSYSRLEDYDAALIAFDRAGDLFSQTNEKHNVDLYGLWFDTGAIYSRKGDQDQALGFFGRCMAGYREAKEAGIHVSETKLADIYRMRGKAKAIKGDKEGAREEFQAGLDSLAKYHHHEIRMLLFLMEQLDNPS